MEIKTTSKGSYHLVTCSGELRATDGETIEERLHPLIAPRESSMVLDMSGVMSVDSGGLSQLIGLTTHARLSESRVVLVSPTSFVAGVFEVTKLDSWFEIAGDVAEAERLLAGN